MGLGWVGSTTEKERKVRKKERKTRKKERKKTTVIISLLLAVASELVYQNARIENWTCGALEVEAVMDQNCRLSMWTS